MRVGYLTRRAIVVASALVGAARHAPAQSFQACTQPVMDGPLATAPIAIVSADFNKDGDPDLALVDAQTGASQVFVLLLHSSAILSQACAGIPAPSFITVGSAPVAVATGDLDRDNDIDLAVAEQDGVLLIRGDGNGGFVPDARPLSAGVDPRSVTIVDLDGDGRNDIVVGNGNGSRVSILYGTGTLSGFEPATGMASDGPATSVVVADFNSDGFLDIIAASSLTNRATVFLQSPTVPRSFPTDQMESLSLGTAPSALVAADLNGDAKTDLTVTSGGPMGRLDVFFRSSGGFMSPVAVVGILRTPSAATAADFNRDANLDVAVTNQSENTVSFFLGSATGQLTETSLCGNAPNRCAVGVLPKGLVVADVDADGRPDVVTANQGGSISLLLTSRPTPLPTDSPTITPTESPTVTPTPSVTATPGGGDCCSPHPGIGCDKPDCQSEVCFIDPACCTVQWDDRCATTDTPLFPAQCQCSLTPSATPTLTETSSPTATGTLPTHTPTPTATDTPTQTQTPTPTITPTPTSSTPSPTLTRTAGGTRTPSTTSTPTITATRTPTQGVVPTATSECFAAGVCIQGNSCAMDPRTIGARGALLLLIAPALLLVARRHRRVSR